MADPPEPLTLDFYKNKAIIQNIDFQIMNICLNNFARFKVQILLNHHNHLYKNSLQLTIKYIIPPIEETPLLTTLSPDLSFQEEKKTF
jgi:hypothetical protein